MIVKRQPPRRPPGSTTGGWLPALLLAVAACGGCSTRECAEPLPENAWYSPLTQPALGTEGAIAIAKRRQGEAIQILSLSGGGQVGAFGAGILNGWSRSGTRPRFDIVAGVSTGAIIATFAFLGEPGDDDQVKSAFLDITEADVFEERFILEALVSDSLNSTERSSARSRAWCRMRSSTAWLSKGRQGGSCGSGRSTWIAARWSRGT